MNLCFSGRLCRSALAVTPCCRLLPAANSVPDSLSRLWHTACLGKEGEVMVFGGSKDDLHFMDTVSKPDSDALSLWRLEWI